MRSTSPPASVAAFDAGVAGEIARTFWDQVRDGLDYVQRGYTRWVVDFNQERQQSLFRPKTAVAMARSATDLALVANDSNLSAPDPWLRRSIAGPQTRNEAGAAPASQSSQPTHPYVNSALLGRLGSTATARKISYSLLKHPTQA